MALLLELCVEAAIGNHKGIPAGVMFVKYAFKPARNNAGQGIEPGDVDEERGFGRIGREVNGLAWRCACQFVSEGNAAALSPP